MRARRTDEGGGVECATDAKSPSRRKLIFMAAVRKRGGRVTRFTICVGKYVLLDQFREGGRALSENADDGRDCAKSHSAGMPYTRLEFLLRNDNEKANQFRCTCGRGIGQCLDRKLAPTSE